MLSIIDILLHMDLPKKSQKTPINEIKKAQVIKKEFEGEQKNENN
ncbi:putative toxin-antitoxin system, toxin component, RelE family [Streptococcus constellatus subsp. constellatus SK53]|uniref:Toxin-antitoxin system, toxin component, RelE family n=1 Tax=Streptococcus constellatus subsp. constellatus SK53 TaxID=1095730 RepID=A0AAD2SV29_STRCV|nr:putative toxin-antitoxin system, toxin component, RelE family [Streptococcus constellatus subsp. constellatus SK53]BBD23388.1 RelE family putative toxin-antitoxin system, toxin component [Streptococcus constellatus subsp. constellatus]